MGDTIVELLAKARSPHLDFLRLLFIENNAADVELCMSELKRAGIPASVEVVDTREDFTQKVLANSYDLILADYNLLGWTGTEAIILLRELGISIPIIIVTGTLGEESSIECLRLGATDLLLKGHLARLPVAVRRALREEAVRAEAARAREEIARINSTLSAQVGELQRIRDETVLVSETGDLL